LKRALKDDPEQWLKKKVAALDNTGLNKPWVKVIRDICVGANVAV
jgi:hypothetical protein